MNFSSKKHTQWVLFSNAELAFKHVAAAQFSHQAPDSWDYMVALKACRPVLLSLVKLTQHISVISSADSYHVPKLRHQRAVSASIQHTQARVDTHITSHTGLGYKCVVIKVSSTFRAVEVTGGWFHRDHNVGLTFWPWRWFLHQQLSAELLVLTSLSSHTDVWHWTLRSCLSRQEIELISPVIYVGSACRASSKLAREESRFFNLEDFVAKSGSYEWETIINCCFLNLLFSEISLELSHEYPHAAIFKYTSFIHLSAWMHYIL